MKMKQRNPILAGMAAICMAVALLMSMSVTASAAISQTEKGSFTVNGVENGVEVTAYQVITVNMGADGVPLSPMYQWADEVSAWLSRNGYPQYVGTDGAVADAFKEDSAGQLRTFWHELAAAIKNRTIPLTGTTQTASGTSVTFTNMNMGEYLLTAKGGTKIYEPTTVQLVPTYDNADGWTLDEGTVGLGSGMKGSTLIIDKEPEDPTVAVGDTVTYEVTATVPTYPENATAKTFVLGDKFGTGLTFDGEDTIHVYSDEAHQTEITGASNFTISTTPGAGDDYDFQISFTEAFLGTYEGTTIYVTYTGTVTEDAVTVDAAENAAYIGYNNDPYDRDSYKEITTDTPVYTYAIALNKVDSNGTTPLSGAEFALAKKGAEGTKLTFNETSGGNYVYEKNGSNTVLKVNSSGRLVLDGLDVGDYVLTETKAPDGGYVLPTGKIEISLTDQQPDGTLDSTSTATPSGSYQIQGTPSISKDTITVTVKNSKGFSLPVTGGVGTVLFTVAGLALMSGAVMIIVSQLRRRRGGN